MTTAWTKGIALGLLLVPLGCDVSVGDGPIGDGGDGGSAGSAGVGGSGDAGSAGSAGAGAGGSAGDGTAGSAGSAGSAGTDTFPPPTCSAEPSDADDACVQCLKAQCCNEWLECDDQTCADEWMDIAECSETVADESFLDEETYSICISENTGDNMLPEQNTNALLSCLNETVSGADAGLTESRCALECFGSEVSFD